MAFREPPTVQLLSMDDQATQFLRRQRGRRIAIFVVLGSLWLALAVIPIGRYVIIRPGSADSVDARLTVNGAKTFAPKGETFWATVGIVERPSAMQLVAAWLSGEQDAPRRRDIYGNESVSESRRQSSAQMEDAKQVAEIVAARKLGFPVRGGGAELAEVSKDYPASKVLKAGDLITAVNGTPVCLQADIAKALRGRKPGSKVDVTLRRGTTSMTLATPTVGVKGYALPVFGVLLTAATKQPCHAPFSVAIDTRSIGGPSAGLAMTIALLERLSPGELTGRQKVAVTGTIEGDETVGEVGGVKQKTLAVRAAGAKLFIVPKSEVALARPHAGTMRVVGVKNLDEALAALRQLGGDPLPPRA